MSGQRPFLDRVLVAEMVPLRRYARSLTRDSDGAEDLMQAGLLRALSRAEDCPPHTNLRSWLFAITRNEFICRLRRTRSRGMHLPADEAAHGMAVAPDQEWRVELRQLHRAVMKLPESERRLLGAVAYDGCSYADAAAGLEVAVGTVKSRVARTRQRLRET
ncbi:MAG: sigma-70 family RNA polymerase sigma factor [Alphaproteobacteria bacterium]